MSGLPDAVKIVSGRDHLAAAGIPDPLADVYDLGESTEPPPPREWVVDRLIPAGCPTSLYAKGGSAKSILALFVAFAIARGEPVFGYNVQHGKVLILDAELDRTSTLERAWMISRGFGLERPPAGLHYHRLRRPLTDAACHADVLEKIHALRPRLTIVDSFTAALWGRDSNQLDDVTQRMAVLDDLGTVLVIDHTPKGADIAGDVTAIGSAAKGMFARSTLFVASNGKASILKHTKSNFGPLCDPVNFALSFSEGMVILDAPIRDDDPRLQGIEAALPLKGRIKSAFAAGEYPHGANAKTIAFDFDAKQGSVRNVLTELRYAGLLRNDSGLWFLV